MRVVALISGGKDSCYNMMQCVSAGHTIVALANLMPADDGVSDERDSFMYQTVGHQVVALYAEAVGVPLYRLVIQGSSLRTEREYTHTDGDEVEDLYGLLKLVQEKENVEGVSVGAILSDYQRVRVENVCARLQLQPLTYLWGRDQAALLSEMISTGVHAIIIKVAAIGLDPEKHLGKPLVEMEVYLKQLSEKFGVHICGEGGEYETLTTDCPLFKKKIVIDAAETVIHSADAFAPVGYLRVTRMHTEEKTPGSGGRLPSLGTCPCQKAIEEMTEELEYSDKRRDVQGECPSHADRSCQPEPDCLLSHSVRTSAGFQWMAGLTALPSPHPDVQTQTRQVFTLLERELQQESWSLEHVVLVHLYLSDMKNFSQINSVYTTFFTRSPPARVCVQASLPAGQLLRMDVLLHNQMCVEEEEDATSHRDTLHVQSISHWAPANIGPYSQAVQVCGAVFSAGQVALIPCSMCMVEGPVELQARLCFRHTEKVLSAVRSPLTLAHVLQAHLYVTDPQHVEPVIAAWRCSGLRDAQVSVAVVASLPRAAQVEVEVVAVQDVPADRRCDVVVVETGGGPVECGLLRSSCGRYACVALSFRASADRPAPQVVVPALISAFTDLLHKNPDLSPLCARVFYLRLDPDATDITTALQRAMSHIPHRHRPALTLVPVEHLPDQRLLHVSCWISV